MARDGLRHCNEPVRRRVETRSTGLGSAMPKLVDDTTKSNLKRRAVAPAFSLFGDPTAHAAVTNKSCFLNPSCTIRICLGGYS
jgi:hypothetical protein